MHMEDQKIREDARKIMDAALHAALPDTAVEKALAEMPDASGRLILVAAGKAAWQMAAAAYRILGERIDDGIVITKERYRIPYQSFTIELDLFSGAYPDLVLAEIEFSSQEEAASFVPPDWLGREVTYDTHYHNSYLSRRTEP